MRTINKRLLTLPRLDFLPICLKTTCFSKTDYGAYNSQERKSCTDNFELSRLAFVHELQRLQVLTKARLELLECKHFPQTVNLLCSFYNALCTPHEDKVLGVY